MYAQRLVVCSMPPEGLISLSLIIVIFFGENKGLGFFFLFSFVVGSSTFGGVVPSMNNVWAQARAYYSFLPQPAPLPCVYYTFAFV